MHCVAITADERPNAGHIEEGKRSLITLIQAAVIHRKEFKETIKASKGEMSPNHAKGLNARKFNLN